MTFHFISICSYGYCQELNTHTAYIDFGKDNQEGFSRIETDGIKLFFLGETVHRLQATPQLTLEVLSYLNQEANVNIFAIEAGYSVACLMNKYLETKDSLLLRQISRNTMFWGEENYKFLQDLAAMNDKLSKEKKVIFRNIDVEFKAEAAILLINLLMEGKEIPKGLDKTLGVFRSMFEAKRVHRESFEGLMVFHYYNRTELIQLISKTNRHIASNESLYKDFFQDDFGDFFETMKGLELGYVNYNYEKPDKNVMPRDDFMYTCFLEIAKEHPNQGILCVVGNAHLEKNWSGSNLRYTPTSPFYNATINIMVQRIKNREIKNKNLKKIDNLMGAEFLKHDCILIKHTKELPYLKAKIKEADYTIYLKNSNYATPFENSYYEN